MGVVTMAKKARTRHRIQQIAEDATRRVAIYIRRSTDEDHQPFSLEAQETKLRAFVASQPGDWQIVAVYSDDASGATTDRPDLQKALRAARAGLFDILLVYRVDRFSRSLRDLTGLLDDLDEAGVTFRSATEPFDTSTPVGRMLVQMLGVFAEFERETIIDRVISGMERKAAKGLWTGGARPLGYLIDRTLDNLVPEPTEAATVRRIFDLYTKDRLGTQAIATRLNSEGLRTRVGKPWSQHTVEIILTNRIYLGEKRFRDIIVPNAHEPNITAAQFDLAQRILGKRSAEIGQRAANPSDYSLTGLIRCPQCGRRYVGTAAHGRYKTYRYYTCWSRVRYGTKAGCDIHRLNADDLEKAISAALLDFYTTGGDLIAEAVTQFQASHAASSVAIRAQLATVNRELKEATAAIDRYLIAFEKGTLDDDDPDVRARLSTLKDQSKALRMRKAQLEYELDQPPQTLTPGDLGKIRRRVRHVLTEGAPNARKAMFEALIHEITITADDAVRPTFKLPLDGNDEGLALQGPAPTNDAPNQAVRALPTMVGRTGFEPAGAHAGDVPAGVPADSSPLGKLIGRLGPVAELLAEPGQVGYVPSVETRYEAPARGPDTDDPFGTLIHKLALLPPPR
jgi:site-specific DNA recombinase